MTPVKIGDEWGTPPDIIERVKAVFRGKIDLDPASNDRAQKIVRAEHWLDKAYGNATFELDWRGKVFLNPPYSFPLVSKFAYKLLDEIAAPRITEAICLVNASTDTAWFHSLLYHRTAVCFTKGRIAFLGPDGTPKTGARMGQAIFYFGPHPDSFHHNFSELGYIL